MADSMSLTQIPLTIIVAATMKNGIGKANGLPWPMLKKDMAYFARVTKRVPMLMGTGSVQSDKPEQSLLSGTRQNVVIMGRKTWESIPPKFRPLKDRTNIVISSQDRSALQPIPEDVVVAKDIDTGLQMLEKSIKEGKSLPVGRAFVIGGSSIYKAALDLPRLNRILLTRIGKEYDCDTFFPVRLHEIEHLSTAWRCKTHRALQEYVQEDIEENVDQQASDHETVPLHFQLYERVA